MIWPFEAFIGQDMGKEIDQFIAGSPSLDRWVIRGYYGAQPNVRLTPKSGHKWLGR